MVEWTAGAIQDPSPPADAVVRQAEDELRVDLPADFLAVARACQGARPQPGGVTLPDGSVTAVDCLLHFEDAPFTTNILAAGFPYEGILPKGVIPFARDIGGDVYCFNYRDDYDRPSVVYWSADTGMVPLAASFTEFVASLHD